MAGLFIRSLRLAEFRSHKALRLSFDGRPVAVWGANGAGKTNLLEAVSLLSPGRGLRRASGGDLARIGGPAAWKIAAEIAAPDGLHTVETWAEPPASRAVRIDDKPAPQIALGRLCPMLWLVPAMDRLWTEAPEGRRRFLDRMTLSLAPEHAETVLAYDRAMRDRNRLLRDGIDDPRWHGALEGVMADQGARIAQARAAAVARINAMQSVGDAAFPAADLAVIGPDGPPAPAGREPLAEALARGRRRDLAAGRSLTGPHRDDLAAVWRAKGVPAAQCSTGEQKALLLSVLLANARALARSGAAPVLLLDEVAAHLDPARCAALFDAVCTLGAQAFMTGTAAELFTALGDRGQGLSVAEADGISTVTACALPTSG